MSTKLLTVVDATKHFQLGKRLPWKKSEAVHAVDGVSFSVSRGETLSIVGESGCGKSTLARVILRLTDITSGEIWLDGIRIDSFSLRKFRRLRSRIQVVFQDPFSSLNPRMRVRDILTEPLRNFSKSQGRETREARLLELLEWVRLPAGSLARFPHEFSGGQRQRIAIARALASEPELLVCDEAVSALDVSVKAQIVNLLRDLQDRLGLALLFISHDLAIVANLTRTIAVMYLGKIVEIGDAAAIFSSPQHPYTKALLAAVPRIDPGGPRSRSIVKGDIPSAVHPPSGCRFHTRCPLAFARCREETPVLRVRTSGQMAACHLNETS